MAGTEYDAIVVGARCAGSPTAMLLARKGYRVLMVDKATFPSDTISTHLVHTAGVAALQRWGLLERVTATGTPPIHTYTFDFGPFKISGSPAIEGSAVSYGPRRTVIDKILVDAAVEAGVEMREAFTVQNLLVEGGQVNGIRGHARGGSVIEERARIVIGADGRQSLVAKAVKPDQYNEKLPLLSGYYSYWSGLPMDGKTENFVRAKRGFAAWETNHGLTLIVGGWPYAEFEANRDDVEGNFLKAFELAPEFAERVRAAKREEPFRGAFVPNYFRKPYGPGWALVGDAGYNKDFITAQGMQDAFLDAELCSTAIDEALSGKRHYYAAMGDYQSMRDSRVTAMYGFTTMLATMEPPPPEMQRVLHAVSGSREASDGFVRVAAGVMSPAEFFSEANLAKVFATAGA